MQILRYAQNDSAKQIQRSFAMLRMTGFEGMGCAEDDGVKQATEKTVRAVREHATHRGETAMCGARGFVAG